MASSASFRPPTVPDTGAATTARLPAWILLDKYVHIENRQNATEARSWTSGGQQVIVSFSTAEPPELSHFSVHCPGLSREDFVRQTTCVVHSQDNLALLSICLRGKGGAQTDYFMYRAGSKPSLKSLHGLDPYAQAAKLYVGSIGFVTLGDGGEHFVLAALKYTQTAGQYELHVFRSNLGTWTRNVLLHAELSTYRMYLNPDKVIALGRSGKIGWVDLWEGILVCDVTSENPALSFIPLPALLPANQVEFEFSERGDARTFRDVVFVDGVIRCVEREICTRRVVREIRDVWGAEVLHDSGFWSDRAGHTKEEEYEYLGWRIITWSRPVSSSCWHRGYLVHVDEIFANDPSHSCVMLADINRPPRNLTLKELVITCFPTLSMVNGDVVYLVCKGELKEQKAWALTVDMRNKAAEDQLVPYSLGGSYFSGINYISCALSKYLNTD